MKQVKFVIKKSDNNNDLNKGLIYPSFMSEHSGNYFRDMRASMVNNEPDDTIWVHTPKEAHQFSEYAEAEKMIDSIVVLEKDRYLYQIKKIYVPE